MADQKDEVKTSNEEGTVSLEDIVQENQELQELEADARAVLGNSDDEHCTYDKGYMLRQALYACQTCRTEYGTTAAVCLACSYACHDGHDLVELYTKRHFRCDCGNDKFPGRKCTLTPEKAKTNILNKYNQNFKGLYCICHRPYPDPEDTVEDEMIQCCVCEDWLHGRHLGKTTDSGDGASVPTDYHEMVCRRCMNDLPFLTVYHKWAKGKSALVESPGAQPCMLAHLRTRFEETEIAETAAFWAVDWREHLCKCDDCEKMYVQKEVSFITSIEDTVAAYERRGRSSAGAEEGFADSASDESREEASLNSFLGGMDRFQQGEMIAGYNDMKVQLQEYLKKFAENGKVVREEDIREFFQNMESRKKQKGNPQYFCG